MLLSFSIPRMLPMILNGLPDSKKAAPHLSRWYIDTWEPKYQVESPDRVKRQTIRAIRGPNSPYIRLRPGFPLGLWWKSRTPERKHLATVACTKVRRIELERFGSGQHAYCLIDGQFVDRESIRRLTYEDGFVTPDEFLDFFVPQVGDNFYGVIINW